ncbi:putative protein FAR1-RELATED SEQUENCE 10 isoform X2 [Rhododendron vialii]|uniref:putative protein FAR1-RELATED SEQUENCE 10 isoform X2 n=1 Tax=Rhododendron vialii TaxID=182163 RepID=UPI0026604CBE|nr:putative protein FAR1-RELATED SEQUENCE 10 isoform X2 [Rhododendron vialii]
MQFHYSELLNVGLEPVADAESYCGDQIIAVNFSTHMSQHFKMTEEPAGIQPDADMNDSDADNKMAESMFGREICGSEGEMLALYDERELIIHETDGNGEPYIGMEFESEEAAMAFYDAYAKRMGFIIRVGNCHRSSHDGSLISRRFLCNKEGFRVNNRKLKRLEVRKPRELTREGCKAMIMVRKEKSEKWVVTKLETVHSHPLGIPAGKGRRGTVQARPQDEKDKKIRELSTQLQRTNQQLAECRNKLDMVLKDIENHTSHLTKSIQEIVEKVKEVEDEEEEEEEDQLQPS